MCDFLGLIDLFDRYIYGPVKEYYDTAKKWKEKLDALEAKIGELKENRVAVQNVVDEAERCMRVANENVKQWLREADECIRKEEEYLKKHRKQAGKKLSEAAGSDNGTVLSSGKEDRPEKDRESAEQKHFFKWRPNIMTRHEVSEAARQSESKIGTLIERALTFKTNEGVSSLPPGASAQQFVPSNNEIILRRKEIVEKVVEALKAPDINEVGLYGMGGSGKTVLAWEVRNRVLQNLFDAVVMCHLPGKPSIREIQQMIIDELGLNIVEKEELAVATHLLNYLEGKNVLVVLDNLWQPLDLRKVGIPIRNKDKGCKMLLTFRDLNILPENGMRCRKNIPIPLLSQEEAEELFKRIAGYGSADGNASDSIAREIVQDCAGLPVSIVAAAKGLKRRPLHVWQSVRRGVIGNTMKEEQHSSIEMSYQLLESKELQSAFVLCSLMANKCRIRDFLKFSIALDVFDEFLSVEEAQDEVRSLVLKLREASLLLGTDSSEDIVMHDVVRYVGRSIASRDYQAYTRSQGAELKRWPREDRKRICLYCPIVNLPRELNYPELEFLVIDGKDGKLEVSKSLNLETKKLRVLALYCCSVSSLPSFKSLNSHATLCLDGSSSLATLCLDGCKFGEANIDTIGKLQNLEILSFVKSDIKSLPEKLGELSKLRILDLSDCSQLEVIPPKVISRLISLEELYMANSFNKWEKGGRSKASLAELKKGEGGSTASLAELKELSHLTNLEICIPDEGMMPENLFSDKLKRYNVTIGSKSRCGRSNEGMRRLLKLKLDTSILKESYGVRKLVRKAEVLHLEEMEGVESNLYQLDREGFPDLKHLNISSKSIKYIVHEKKCYSSSFPQLESLILKELVSLQKICDGNLRARSLCNLKDLQVECCSALKSLLSITTAQKLFNLESITVKGCESLEEIVAQEGDHTNQDKQACENAFPELRFLDLRGLPKLRNFYSEDKKLSENTSADKQNIPSILFNGKIVFSKLEALTLHSASNIQRLWHDDHEAIDSSIRNLKRLTVEKCDKLEYLFTLSTVRGLEQLQYLSVRDCNKMEQIIVEAQISGKGESKEMKQRDEEKTFASRKKDGKGGERSREMVLPELSTLLLENLKILKRFCTGVRIDCPVLKRLNIKSCEKLETFISKSSIARQEPGGHAENPIDTQSPKSYSDQQPVNPQSQKRSLFKFSLLKGRHARAEPALKKLGTFFMKSFKRHSEGRGGPLPEENLQSDIQPLFDEKVSFPRLEEMQLFDINHKEIWHKEFTDGSFCDLKKLTVIYCGNLQRVFPSNAVERFKRLDNLVITDCKSVVEIFELSEKDNPQEQVEQQEKIKEGNMEEHFQLRRISLRNLGGLESIWNRDPMGAIILENLRSVEAVSCPNLKYIFPFSIADKLEELEELKITHCERMEYVIDREEKRTAVHGKASQGAGRNTPQEGDGKVAKQENVEGAPYFWFPSLTCVILYNLPIMSSFYPEQCRLDDDSLKIEELKDCGVKKFSKLKDLTVGGQLHTESVELPSSSGEKAMENLEFVNKETHVSAAEFSVGMASTSNTLELEGLGIKSDVCLLNFLQKFLDREKLVVTNSSVKVLFSCEGMLAEQGIGKLVRIRNLEISSVRGLLHIWEEDYRLDPLLQYLETLDVQYCHQMLKLLPLSASLKNLTSLKVKSCNELSSIMTSSTARTLVQLKQLNVQDCSKVKEIVADQGDEMNDAIIFSRLEHLELVSLPDLLGFSGDSFTFIFPSMKEVIVRACPKMEFFSKGLLRTPELNDKGFQGDPEYKMSWDVDLNSIIGGSSVDLPSSAQDSSTTLNKKGTKVHDAESDDNPLVRKNKGKARKIKGKEDSTLPEAEIVYRARWGEIEEVPTTNNT